MTAPGTGAPTVLDGAALHDLLRDRLAERPLLVLLDVDGTLSPIAPRPEDAVVSDRVRGAIRSLVTTPLVHVALVSGRGAADAYRMVGVEGVWAVGNHGIETIDPAGATTVESSVVAHRDAVVAAAAAVERRLDAFAGTHLENKGWTLSVHWRQADEAVEEPLRNALERIAADHGLRVTTGKCVFELRPPVHVHKGSASIALATQLLGSAGGMVLYAGDDRTDEDAFVALRALRPAAITVRVLAWTEEASTATAAEHLLSGVGAMEAFLERLAAHAAADAR